MNRIPLTIRHLFGLLALLVITGASAQFTATFEPAASAATATQHEVFLPLVSTNGNGAQQPTPAPPPVKPAGFFALNDYLTYNAATAVDANGVVHLAFYVSDERHQDQPLGQPVFVTVQGYFLRLDNAHR